jgi:hypothetical protein
LPDCGPGKHEENLTPETVSSLLVDSSSGTSVHLQSQNPKTVKRVVKPIRQPTQWFKAPEGDACALGSYGQRLVFLLGGSDGETLFSPSHGPPDPPRLRRALRASTSFVLALTRCGALHVDPATAPAFTGIYPVRPGRGGKGTQ